MKRYARMILAVFLGGTLFSLPVFAGEDKSLYGQGVECGREGKIDFAFSYLDLLIKNYPDSKFFPDALFAEGEYYFSNKNIKSAAAAFNRLAGDYPDSGAVIFAFFYLREIALKENNDALAKELESRIIKAKTNFLIFKDFKEYRYKSALSWKYKARYFIDRIEVFINDELAASIAF